MRIVIERKKKVEQSSDNGSHSRSWFPLAAVSLWLIQRTTHPMVVYVIISIPMDYWPLLNRHWSSSWLGLCSWFWCNSTRIFVVGFKGVQEMSYHVFHHSKHLRLNATRSMTHWQRFTTQHNVKRFWNLSHFFSQREVSRYL